MSIADFSGITVRKEVINRQIHGVVRLYRVQESSALESDAERFLHLTYPTALLTEILSGVQKKLTGQEARGVFVVTGGGGTGKSHLTVSLYHALNSPDVAAKWLGDRWMGDIPADTDVIAVQLVGEGGQISYLWQHIFGKLGVEELAQQTDGWLDVAPMKQALKGKPVVVILDEWEDWFLGRSRQQQQWNRNFLQNLAEVADDPDCRLTLVVSSLERQLDISFVLSRPNLFKADLSQGPDREQIALFRLFEEGRQCDENVVEAYVNLYSVNQEIFGNVIRTVDAYRDLLRDRYPIHPELLQLAFEAFGRFREYQNTRGVLRFLADVLLDRMDKTDLLLPADVNPHHQGVRADLNSLGSESERVTKFLEDLNRVSDIDHVQGLLMPILLWSMTDAGGLEWSRILLGSLRPHLNIDALQNALLQVYDRTWYLKRHNGRFVFELRRKVRVIVHERASQSLSQSDKEAVAKLAEVLKEVVKPPRKKGEETADTTVDFDVLVHPVDAVPSQTAQLKLVYSLENLDEQGCKEFFAGREYANTIVLILPVSGQDLRKEGDFLVRSQRLVECGKLKGEVAKEEQKELDDVTATERSESEEALRLAFGRRVVPFKSGQQVAFRFEQVPPEAQEVIAALRKSYTKWAVKARAKEKVDAAPAEGVTIGQLLKDFYKYQDLPLLLSRDTMGEAAKELCLEGAIVIVDGLTTLTADDAEQVGKLAIGESLRLRSHAAMETVPVDEEGKEEEGVKPPVVGVTEGEPPTPPVGTGGEPITYPTTLKPKPETRTFKAATSQ